MTIEEKNLNAGVVLAEVGEIGAKQPAVPPLSDTALVILAAAANRPDGSLLPVPASVKARGSARSAVLFHLSRIGLAEEVPVELEAESWRRGEEFGFLGMRITAAGLAAVGIDAKDDSDSVTEPFCEATSRETAGEAEPASEAPEKNADVESSDRPGDETGAASRFTDPGLERITIDDLVADDGDSTGFTGSGVGTASSRRLTKQDQILALLSREEGASIDVLMAATGWLPHTVRAALSGLRKKGHAIDRRKDGEAGSVYRIMSSVEAGAVPNAAAEDDAS
jgi:hypothetical protein